MLTELLLPIITAYPGYSLVALTILLYAAISAVPASFQALRGSKCGCDKDSDESD